MTMDLHDYQIVAENYDCYARTLVTEQAHAPHHTGGPAEGTLEYQQASWDGWRTHPQYF